ncbi:hypothetical protein [Burkholderia orbicola]|uniref:hypothetical protein n=1 Tax=Burkholderia orbicola TaxID=2978683 RepID=UPI002FE3BB1E
MLLNSGRTSPDSVTELIDFYDRVNPVLSKWLAKPTWTASDTAMLCAGFAPNECSSEKQAASNGEISTVLDGVPLDPDEYLPSNPVLYGNLLRRFRDLRIDVGTPKEMMERLGVSRGISQAENGVKIAARDMLRREVIDQLHWLFIIGNAVGLKLPAIIPFGLVSALRGRHSGHFSDKSQEGTGTGTGSGSGLRQPLVGPSSGKSTSHNQHVSDLLNIGPVQRGFYTTEEVARLTNLKYLTLTKYARQRRPIAGFSPYKPQGAKAWRWRDDQQQSAYEAGNSTSH